MKLRDQLTFLQTGSSQYHRSSNYFVTNNILDISIFVKLLTGSRVEVTVNPRDTVLDLKQKLQPITNQTTDQQKLLFLGKTLDDTKTLLSYGIKNGSMINMFIRIG